MVFILKLIDFFDVHINLVLFGLKHIFKSKYSILQLKFFCIVPILYFIKIKFSTLERFMVFFFKSFFLLQSFSNWKKIWLTLFELAGEDKNLAFKFYFNLNSFGLCICQFLFLLFKKRLNMSDFLLPPFSWSETWIIIVFKIEK